MRALYLDCGMGAAGDMLTAALLELFEPAERDELVDELNALGIPGVRYVAGRVEKCGLMGTHVSVLVDGHEEEPGEDGTQGHAHEHAHDHDHAASGHEHHHHHSHSHLGDIEHLVRHHLSLPAGVGDHVMAVYDLIAQAESHAHGVPMDQVHFHEVGTLDAVADVCAVCLLMDRLAPDVVLASPVHVGSGTVRCAHGVLPVPAPAVAHILRGVPIYGGQVAGELCTPTGAALLKHFVSSFGDMPVMAPERIGYGMGTKDFERVNCVRAVLGTVDDPTDGVSELSCNVDDMTAEALGFACEELMREGALEAYTVPVGMKKSRPGTLLCVMCPRGERERFVRLIFKHTTTIGVRESVSRRCVLARSMEVTHTSLGDVRKKVSQGYGVRRSKYEYDDLVRIARERGLSLAEVRMEVARQDTEGEEA